MRRSEARPSEVRSTIVEGTRRVVELCRATRRRVVCWRLSSGAVYRRPSVAGRPLSEDDPLGWDTPDDDRWVYHQAKRQMESLVVAGGLDGGPAVSIARLFAFVGPGLPLDRHFAIANFIADARRGRAGGGTWRRDPGALLSLRRRHGGVAVDDLLDGPAGRAYNVGSQRPVTIAEAAGIAAAAGDAARRGADRGRTRRRRRGHWYVPDTRRARGELGLDEWTGLEDAVRRTIAWHRQGLR